MFSIWSHLLNYGPNHFHFSHCPLKFTLDWKFEEQWFGTFALFRREGPNWKYFLYMYIIILTKFNLRVVKIRLWNRKAKFAEKILVKNTDCIFRLSSRDCTLPFQLDFFNLVPSGVLSRVSVESDCWCIEYGVWRCLIFLVDIVLPVILIYFSILF